MKINFAFIHFLFSFFFLLGCKTDQIKETITQRPSFYGTWIGKMEGTPNYFNSHYLFVFDERFSGNAKHFYSQLLVKNDTFFFEHKCHRFNMLNLHSINFPTSYDIDKAINITDSTMIIEQVIPRSNNKYFLKKLLPANTYQFKNISFTMSGSDAPTIKLKINKNGILKFEGHFGRDTFPTFEGYILKEYMDFLKNQLNLIKPIELSVKRNYVIKDGVSYKLIIELDNGKIFQIEHDLFYGPASVTPLINTCLFAYNYCYKPL